MVKLLGKSRVPEVNTNIWGMSIKPHLPSHTFKATSRAHMSALATVAC